MKYIYTLIVFQFADEKPNKVLDCGWAETMHEAVEWVEKDYCGLSDNGYYDYLLIEKKAKGLYNMGITPEEKKLDRWFRWDNNKWVKSEPPKFFQ